MRQLKLLHKKIFIIALGLFLINLLTSCDPFGFLYEPGPDTALEYLNKRFNDSFSNERRLSNSSEDVLYTKFYSNKLKKDIVVREYLNKDEHNKIHHSFSSNYLFVKYDSSLNFTKDMFKEDFSNTRVIYDFDKIFTYFTEKDDFKEKQIIEDFTNETKYKTAYIIIHADEEEAAGLEYRLKSFTHRLQKDYYVKKVYFFITSPQSRSTADKSIDYSSLTVQELCSDQNIFSSFAKVYKRPEYQCQFDEISNIGEIKNE